MKTLWYCPDCKNTAETEHAVGVTCECGTVMEDIGLIDYNNEKEQQQ